MYGFFKRIVGYKTVADIPGSTIDKLKAFLVNEATATDSELYDMFNDLRLQVKATMDANEESGGDDMANTVVTIAKRLGNPTLEPAIAKRLESLAEEWITNASRQDSSSVAASRTEADMDALLKKQQEFAGTGMVAATLLGDLTAPRTTPTPGKRGSESE